MRIPVDGPLGLDTLIVGTGVEVGDTMGVEQSDLGMTAVEDDSAETAATYWLPPVAVDVETLHPSLRAAVALRADAEGFAGYHAHVYAMPGDVECGHFHLAINPQTSKAVGLHTVSLVLGEIYAEDIELAVGPIWLYADNEIQAADDLYQILRDVGRLA